MPNSRPTDSDALPTTTPLSPRCGRSSSPLVAFIVVNTIVFPTLAVLNKLPGEGKALVFIDFGAFLRSIRSGSSPTRFPSLLARPVPALRIGIAAGGF